MLQCSRCLEAVAVNTPQLPNVRSAACQAYRRCNLDYTADENHFRHLLLSVQLAIYSEADRLQPHRYKADESYETGEPGMTPVQCYLDYEGILALAK